MPDLVAILTLAGIPVSDQRVPGRPYAFAPRGVMLHHTASRAGSGDLPSLRICRQGRSDLQGPLCNLLVGRAGTVVAISDGYANHAGRMSADAWSRLTTGREPVRQTGPDNGPVGNGHLIGIENNGLGEPWPADQVDVVIDICVAICSHFGWDPTSAVIGHKEGTRRKIDPSFDTGWFRSQVVKQTTTTPPSEEDDMPLNDEDWKRLRAEVRQTVFNAIDEKLLGKPNPETNKPHDPSIDLERIEEAVRNDKGATAFTAATHAADNTDKLLKQ